MTTLQQFVDLMVSRIKQDPYLQTTLTGGRHRFDSNAEIRFRDQLRMLEYARLGVLNKFRTAEEMASINGVRLDSNEGLLFQRQLEAIDPRTFEIKHKPIRKWREWFSVNNSIGPGATHVTYRMYEYTGEAKVVGSGATDIPSVDADGTEYSNKVVPVKLKYSYSTDELRKAIFGNLPLDTHKVVAAQRGFEKKFYKLTLNGDTDSGLEGVINHTGVTNVQAAAAAGGGNTRQWDGADKTPDEIIADVRTAISGMRADTYNEFSPTHLGLPQSQYDKISMTPRSSTSDTTIMQYIMGNQAEFGLREIVVIPDLKDAHSGGGDMGLFWVEDPMALEVYMNMEPQYLPMQIKGTIFDFIGEAEYGGVTLRYAKAMRQLYDI